MKTNPEDFFKTDHSGLDTVSLFAHVLLIEDDKSHAQLIKRALRSVVGEVDFAYSAKEAVEALTSSLPELVFCDLFLPDGSGFELLETIQSLRPGLPVVVMTSSSRLDHAVEAMRKGAWDYMVKEFSDTFAHRIEIVVERLAKRKLHQIRELQVTSERDAFFAAAQTAVEGVAILGSDGEIIFTNEAFERFCRNITGGKEGARNKNLVELLANIDSGVSEGLRGQLEETVSEGALWRSELKVEHVAVMNALKHYELRLTSFGFGSSENSGDESIVDWAAFRRNVIWVRDISGQKAQEKFQRDILSTTSHDLKGPLGAIITSAELLSDAVPVEDERGQLLLTRVGSCARNCVTLIDELLSARRIQDGVLVIKPKWYSVDDALEDIVLDYLPSAKARLVKLSSAPVLDDLQVFADRLGLHRVLSNLVNNSIKFTPEGGEIELSAGRRADEVFISIRDTGSGISEKARDNLFEKYSRLDKHQEIDGTGLGLFVVKSIVDAHEGRIQLTSAEGQGTTFVVSFPDERKEEVEEA